MPCVVHKAVYAKPRLGCAEEDKQGSRLVTLQVRMIEKADDREGGSSIHYTIASGAFKSESLYWSLIEFDRVC